MRKLLLFGILVAAFSCQTESDVDPATGTFMRYFGSEKNHSAILALEADDGYTLLSNVDVQNATTTVFKIKMIHTDKNGNFVWEQSYPAYGEPNEALPIDNMKGSSFIPLANSGYLIIGDRINDNGSNNLLLLHLDLNGNMLASKTISGEDLDLNNPTLYGGKKLHGHAVVASEDENGPNYLILGSIENDADEPDMFVARISATDLSLGWTREYGAAKSEVVNRLYTTPDQNVFWSGSVNNYGQQDIRVVKVGKDSQLSFFGTPLLTPTIDETAFDICPTSGGWAITGSTKKGDADNNIYLMKLSANSELAFYRSYGIDPENESNQTIDFGLNDSGNSICQGVDGGLVMLATVESAETQQDLYLIKVDGINGDIVWKNNFGGDDREDGASIRALQDGSYLVFGTAYFGRVKKLMLMKVNKNGAL